MGRRSACFPAAKFPILFFFLLQLCLTATAKSSREALEVSIGIGVGGGAEAPSPSEESPPSPPCGCVSPGPPQPSDFQDVKLYLAYKVIQRFKQTITCDPRGVTSSWTGADICKTYQGFFCSNPPDNKTAVTVASVDFNGFGLCAPTVSGFVDQLPDLALFHANSNNFTGTLPDLSRLPYIYELDVSNNRMSGAYPTNTLALSNLLFLDLRYNLFSGSVPPFVFSSLDLDVLFLNNNGFTGQLPPTLGCITAAYLTLANNGFTGPIPGSIGNTSGTLVEVLLLNNRLSGCLPFQIGLLNKATVFDAGYNQLTGPLPLSFACLASVEQLNFAGNLLYGHVPDGVCQLGNLANLSLSQNYFTSLGASCWRLLKTRVLDVRFNCIPGLPMQRSLAQCAAFAAKPKFCSFVPSLYYIPCKSCSQNNATDAKRVLPAPPWAAGVYGKGKPAPSPTYGALHRQNP
uniref:Uncharacterized protein At4g06744 n=1 Tax=Anthurium amnicola TaxID=1678845 RepID=A0A1D1Y9F9_9ARAE